MSEPSGEQSGRFGDFEQVAETPQLYEAELIALRLRGEGLQAELVDQVFHQEPLPSVRALSVVRVLVPLAQAARARELLAHAAPLPEDAEWVADAGDTDAGDSGACSGSGDTGARDDSGAGG